MSFLLLPVEFEEFQEFVRSRQDSPREVRGQREPKFQRPGSNSPNSSNSTSPASTPEWMGGIHGSKRAPGAGRAA